MSIAQELRRMHDPDFRLFFSQGRGFMTRVVRWFCRSRYLAHTVGCFSIFKAEVIMESSESGVQFAPVKHFYDNNTIEAIVRPLTGPLVSKDGMSEHLSWLIEKYGADSYDWMAAGSIGIFNRIKWLWCAIGSWLKTRWGKNAVHCTELWVNLLQHAEYKAVLGMSPELSDPLRLLKALQEDKTDWLIVKVNPAVQKEIDQL